MKTLNPNENPEKWLKNIEASEKNLFSLKGSHKEFRDIFEKGFFAEINPLGLSLVDLRKNLNKEIEDLRKNIDDIRIDSLLSIEVKNNKYESIMGKISEKMNWIQHIDNFNATKGSNPSEDAEM